MKPLRLAVALWLAAGLAVAGFGVSAHLLPASAEVSCDHHCGHHHDDEDHGDRQTETRYETVDHYQTETRTQTVTEDRTHERTVTEDHTSTQTVHDGSHSTHCSGLVSACDVATVTVDAQHLVQQTQSH